jgi:hypothetical protein
VIAFALPGIQRPRRFICPLAFLPPRLLLAAIQPLLAQQQCAALSALSLLHTTITSAAIAAEGPIGPACGGNTAFVMAAAHCDVQAITHPWKDSEIRLEVWLPVSGGNGKYLQVGSGGWGRSIDRTAMADPLRRGYAVAATDDVHQSGGPVPGAPWAVGDAAISPLNSTGYYESVRAFLGRFTDARHATTGPLDFYRLFTVPGMAHCGGGIGGLG